MIVVQNSKSLSAVSIDLAGFHLQDSTAGLSNSSMVWAGLANDENLPGLNLLTARFSELLKIC